MRRRRGRLRRRRRSRWTRRTTSRRMKRRRRMSRRRRTDDCTYLCMLMVFLTEFSLMVSYVESTRCSPRHLEEKII